MFLLKSGPRLTESPGPLASSVQHSVTRALEERSSPESLRDLPSSVQHNTFCAPEGRISSPESLKYLPSSVQCGMISVQEGRRSSSDSQGHLPLNVQHRANHAPEGDSSVCFPQYEVQASFAVLTSNSVSQSIDDRNAEQQTSKLQQVESNVGMTLGSLGAPVHSSPVLQAPTSNTILAAKCDTDSGTDTCTSTDATGSSSESPQRPHCQFCHESPSLQQKTQPARTDTVASGCELSRSSGTKQPPQHETGTCFTLGSSYSKKGLSPDPEFKQMGLCSFDSEATEVKLGSQIACNRQANGSERLHPSKERSGTVQVSPQGAGPVARPAPAPRPKSLLATPVRYGNFSQQRFPVLNRFQAPFCNPESNPYLQHQFNRHLQSQGLLGACPGRPFLQRFHTPPRLTRSAPLGIPGGSYTWPRDEVRFQPSRFMPLYAGPRIVPPAMEPFSTPSLGAVGRGAPGNPGWDMERRVLVNEFSNPVVSERKIQVAGKTRSEKTCLDSEAHANFMPQDETTAVKQVDMSEEGQNVPRQSITSASEFSRCVVPEKMISETQQTVKKTAGGVECWETEAREGVILQNGQKAVNQVDLAKGRQDIPPRCQTWETEPVNPPVKLGESAEFTADDESTFNTLSTKGSTKKAHDSDSIRSRSSETDMGYKSISSNDEGSYPNEKLREESGANSDELQPTTGDHPPLGKKDSGIQSPVEETANRGLGRKETYLVKLKVCTEGEQ